MRFPKIKRGDKIVVVSGRDRGKGPVEVLRVDPVKGQVVVQGTNQRFKHVKRSQQNPKGGRVQREMPLAISNIMLWSEKLKRGVRVRVVEKDGRRIRVGVPCGTEFDK